MQDRLPAPGKANRIKITLDDGNAIEGVLSYADDANQQGSAYNKANVLPDEVCNALGIATTSEPKDAFLANQQAVFLDGFYNRQRPEQIENAEPISPTRGSTVAAAVGNYALFGGGSYSAVAWDNVDTYNTQLIHGTAADLSETKYGLAATNVGDYALFGGGRSWGSSGLVRDSVDAYHRDLVHTTATDLSSERSYLAAASVGNYALFAGGTYGDSGSGSRVVDAYSNALVHTTPNQLSSGKDHFPAAGVGDYALFGGGKTVDVYSSSLVKTITESSQLLDGVAVSIGNYAIFADNGGTVAFDRFLVATVLEPLSQAAVAATALQDYALFCNEDEGMEAYDRFLNYSALSNLALEVQPDCAAATGGYALFVGSRATGVYQATPYVSFTIPAFSKYQFEGYHTQEQYTLTEKQWESQGALTGYIKRGFRLSGYQQID